MYSLFGAVALHGVTDGGIGIHTNEIAPEEKFIAFRAWFICELLYGPISATVRTSIALLLLNLNPSTIQKRILYVCMGAVWLFTIVLGIVDFISYNIFK